jgi:peptidoglycan/LPS O-acetylase OafA/YrhL
MLHDRANNFTLLRLVAALCVLFGRSYALSLGHGEDPLSNFLIAVWGESLPSLAVDLFFVTSGFLVTASFMKRGDVLAFVEARLLRIFPGLFVAVLFCVFVVGALFTTLTLQEYLVSPGTWSYLQHNLVLINGVQFSLPGVFANNPYPVSVNGSLWTLPIEVMMYFWVAVVGMLSLLRDVKVFNLLFFMLCLLFVQSIVAGGFVLGQNPRTLHLAMLFLLGGWFYANKDVVRFDYFFLSMLGVLVVLTSSFGVSLFVKSVFFAYAVLFFALHPSVRMPSLDRYGDVSYGLYIYAFPVQQAIAYSVHEVSPMGMFVLSIFITSILAVLSWQFVEEPALKLKGCFGRWLRRDSHAKEYIP